MNQFEGANIGQGKCPICLSKRGLKMIWLYDDKKKEVIEMTILCNWCWIDLFIKILEINPNIKIKWTS